MQGWQFFGCFEGLLEFFLRRVHFSLDRAHLGIDRIANIGNGLFECPQGIAQSLAQILHVLRGDAGWLRGLRLYRRLLCLYAGHGIFVHNGRGTVGHRFCLSAGRKGRVLRLHHR